MEYQTELKVARKAADAAAEIIRDYRVKENFSVNFKGENDLVTEADLESEETILSIIRRHFPEDEVLAEETAQKQNMADGRVWLVDPIDGTTNFAHGFPAYCVSIGFWENRKPRMGLVLEVSRGEYFTAISGEGAQLNERPIQVSRLENRRHALVGTGFPYNDLSLVDHYLDFFRMLMSNIQGVRRAGAAAYDLCLVAAGRLDGFYEYSLNPWDVGAAALIVREAGGVVTDWNGGDDWLFGKRVVAGNPTVHEFLLSTLQEHFTEAELSGVLEGKER